MEVQDEVAKSGNVNVEAYGEGERAWSSAEAAMGVNFQEDKLRKKMMKEAFKQRPNSLLDSECQDIAEDAKERFAKRKKENDKDWLRAAMQRRRPVARKVPTKDAYKDEVCYVLGGTLFWQKGPNNILPNNGG